MRSTRFKNTKPVENEQEEQLRIVSFVVGDEHFGADILKIKEIDLYEKFTRIPSLPDFIEGFTMIRQEVVPLIDLRKRFYGRAGKEDLDTRIMVVTVAGSLVGFVVDAVLQVMTVVRKAINKPPQLMTAVDEDYIQGVVPLADKNILLVDFDKILSKNKKRELLGMLSEEEKKELARMLVAEQTANAP